MNLQNHISAYTEFQEQEDNLLQSLHLEKLKSLTYKQVVQMSAIAYFCIHSSLWDAKHHMFLALGSGFRWHDGVLIDEHFASPLFFKDKFEERSALEIVTYPTFDREWRGFILSPLAQRSLYPSFESAALFNMPDNVRADYLEGAIDFLTETLKMDLNETEEKVLRDKKRELITRFCKD